MTSNLPSPYGQPSSRAEKQLRKLAEVKVANRAADIVADAWLSGLRSKATKYATVAAAEAASDIVDECLAIMDDNPVKQAIVGKILKTGARKLDSGLRDFDDDDFSGLLAGR